MTILRLNPPIPLDTPKGKALAIIFQDYGYDHHNLWTCVVEATGEIWTFQNPQVRAREDYTFNVRQALSNSVWLDISSAPKNGVTILARSNNSEVSMVSWIDSMGGWIEGDGREPIFPPTHWMPIPDFQPGCSVCGAPHKCTPDNKCPLRPNV